MLEIRAPAVKGFLGRGIGLSCGPLTESDMPEPRVIYEPKPGSPIAVDRPFYDRLATETRSRTLVERLVVPMRPGRAWPARARPLFRINAVEAPRVPAFTPCSPD